MDTVEFLANILEQCENFTISEAINQSKNAFDVLSIVNYLIGDVIDATRYEIETEQQQIDYNNLIKIKDVILNIKNNNA